MESISNFFFGKSIEQQKKEMQEKISEGLRDLKYDEIKVLRRPVSSNINAVVEVATHVYLGYFEDKELVDSLSFDPNEGEGIRDPIEKWNNEYSVTIGERKKLKKYWNSMKEVRVGFEESKYKLLEWNCGHVAAHLLDQCPVAKEDKPNFTKASKWALNSNKAANITNKDSHEIYRDSLQKKDQ